MKGILQGILKGVLKGILQGTLSKMNTRRNIVKNMQRNTQWNNESNTKRKDHQVSEKTCVFFWDKNIEEHYESLENDFCGKKKKETKRTGAVCTHWPPHALCRFRCMTSLSHHESPQESKTLLWKEPSKIMKMNNWMPFLNCLASGWKFWAFWIQIRIERKISSLQSNFTSITDNPVSKVRTVFFNSFFIWSWG